MSTYTHIHLLNDIVENKKFRELICTTYIAENFDISKQIVSFWNLNRIVDKYIDRSRMYDENSYSKRKIKDEEVIFCRKASIFQPLEYYFKEQRIINFRLLSTDGKVKLSDVDKQFYIDTVLTKKSRFDFPEVPIALKKNNRFRLQLTSEIVELASVREKTIKEYFKGYPQLSEFIYSSFKLNFIKYKYIDKTITRFESSYTRQKIKNEEVFFFHKFFQYSIWLRRMMIFDDLSFKLLNEYITEQEGKSLEENKQFIKVLVNNLIENYQDDQSYTDTDINLN